MKKKCLIINGSPKINGNTYFLIDTFIKNCNFKVDVINAFPSDKANGISSCLDCGKCLKRKFCSIHDDFSKIINDKYDVILIASPIYQSNLPGPMINIINRLNFLYNNKKGLNFCPQFKQKKAGLILVGGGSNCRFLQGINNEDLAIKQAQYIFNNLNAKLKPEDIILCLSTDKILINNNEQVLEKIIKMAQTL